MKTPTRRVKEKAVKAWAACTEDGTILRVLFGRKVALKHLYSNLVSVEIRLSKQEKGKKAK